MTDTKPARAAAAANAIAVLIEQRLAVYGNAKVALLTAQLASDSKQIAQLAARTAAAQKALDAIGAGGGSAATKAMAAAPYLGIVQSAASEQQALLDDRRTDSLTLLVARGVEAPPRYSPMRRRPRPRSRRRSRPTPPPEYWWAWSSASS